MSQGTSERLATETTLASAQTDVASILANMGAKDTVSGAVLTVDTEHHEIHEGKHFLYRSSDTIASGASVDFMLTVPAGGHIHLLFTVDFTAITTITFYESGDRNGTAAQTAYNNDRNSGTTPTLAIHKGTSGGATDGTAIWGYASGLAAGASQRVGGEARSLEYILKHSAKYILRVASSTNGNLTNTRLSWYEEA